MTEMLRDAAIYSTLADDPDLGDLVDLFVGEMPDRIQSFQDRMEASDHEGLRRLAHQMKGAAGSYGFATITHSAARLENALREAEPEDVVHSAVEDLIDLCRRARGPSHQ